MNKSLNELAKEVHENAVNHGWITRKPFEYYVDENGCFICTSHRKDTYGYPQTIKTKKRIMVAKYIYEECFGEVEDKSILHKCDNRQCINPEHLTAGTHEMNLHDMAKKGRARNGTTKRRNIA